MWVRLRRSGRIIRCAYKQSRSHYRQSNGDGIDREEALLLPVHVIQVQNHRKLVEHQRRTHPEQHGADFIPRSITSS